jgi:hypothetical protein
MGSHDQAGLGGRGLHQRFEGLIVVKHHALEGAGDVRKDAMLDEIPLRAIRRIVRNPNCAAQDIDQPLQIFFEQIAAIRITATGLMSGHIC